MDLSLTSSPLANPDIHPAAPNDTQWVLEDAIALCRVIEGFAPRYGCHVALTGGTLYKDGSRKDVDLLFYRIRQAPEIDQEGLLEALLIIGFELTRRHGWVQKATYNGRAVDLFFPDHEDGHDPLTGEYV